MNDIQPSPHAKQGLEVRLWDSQWVNVVNAPEVLNASDAQEAVRIAVRMTERFIAHNVTSGNLPPAALPGDSDIELLPLPEPDVGMPGQVAFIRSDNLLQEWCRANVLHQTTALEADREDAEKWRKCNTSYDIGNGERIECHVIVGVNVFRGEEWVGFEQPTSKEFFATLQLLRTKTGDSDNDR